MGWFDSETTTSPKLFGPSKDLMSTILKDARRYYKSGNAGKTFGKPTVVGYGKDIKTGLAGLSALADANSNGQGISGQTQSIIDNGGFTGRQTRTLDGMEDLVNNAGLDQVINDKNGMTRAQNRAYSGLQDTVYGNNATLQDTFDTGGLTDDQNLVADRMRGIATSDFDINANPAYATVRDRALKEAQMGMDAQAAKSGRYGGASSQTIAARERGNLAADMDLAEYRNWQQRGDKSATDLAALSQQGTSNQLGINSAQQAGYGSIADMGALGINQRNNSIGLKSDLQSKLFNSENAGLDRMRQAYDLGQAPSRTQLEVGGMLDAERQNIRNDEIRRFDAKNPMNIYSQFMALANGAPTGTTTSTSPPWANLLAGGGLGLAALANAF